MLFYIRQSKIKIIAIYLFIILLSLIIHPLSFCFSSQGTIIEELEDKNYQALSSYFFDTSLVISHILQYQDIPSLKNMRISSKQLKEYAERALIFALLPTQKKPKGFHQHKEYSKIWREEEWEGKEKLHDLFQRYPFKPHLKQKIYYYLQTYHLGRAKLPRQTRFLLEISSVQKILKLWKTLEGEIPSSLREEELLHYFLDLALNGQVPHYQESGDFIQHTSFISFEKLPKSEFNWYQYSNIPLRASKALLPHNPFLEKFGLSSYRIKSNTMQELVIDLEKVRGLKELSFIKSEIGDQEIAVLGKFLENHKTLTRLNVSHNEITDAGAIILVKSLENNSSLKLVTVENNYIYNEGLLSLKKLERQSKSDLKISTGGVVSQNIDSSFVYSGDTEIAKWMKAPSEVLSLYKKIISRPFLPSFFSILSKTSQLRTLRLYDIKFNPKDSDSLILLLANNSYLTSLSLNEISLPFGSWKKLLSKGSLPSLNNLVLSDTNIESELIYTRKFFETHSCLNTLGLSYNNLDDKSIWLLGNILKASTSFQEIGLAYNMFSIKGIESFLLKVTRLKILNLSHNQLQELPSTLTDLQQLEELYLIKNGLGFLSGEVLNKLTRLKLLYLSENRLRYLPTSLQHLSNLRHLNLNNNSIRELPNSLGDLISLQELNIRDNKLATLPDACTNLRELNHLDIGYNQIEALPENLGYLSKLTYLCFYDNKKISSLPYSFLQLTNLKELIILPFYSHTQAEKVLKKFKELKPELKF